MIRCTAFSSSQVSASTVRKWGVRTRASPAFRALALPGVGQATYSTEQPGPHAACWARIARRVPSVEPLSTARIWICPAYFCRRSARIASGMLVSSLRAQRMTVTGSSVWGWPGGCRCSRLEKNMALIRKPGSSAMPPIAHHRYPGGSAPPMARTQPAARYSETASHTPASPTETTNLVFKGSPPFHSTPPAPPGCGAHTGVPPA